MSPLNRLLGVAQPHVIASEAQLVSELQEYKRPIADASFKSTQHQTSEISAVRLPKLLLTETLTDPIVWKVSPDPHLAFVLPVAGTGKIVEEKRQTPWGGTHRILQLNYAKLAEAHSDKSHVVAIVPVVEQLQRVCANLEGSNADLLLRNLDGASEIYSGVFNRVDYYHHLRELLTIVRLANGDEQFLGRIGVEDVFYKVLAEMLVAKEQRETHSESGSALNSTRSARAVINICDHIRDHVGTPLTIPKMEALTGMTGRALNYAFHSRFNCSPQEWQRNYLLDAARERLLSKSDTRSVKSIAFDHGFSSSSSFTAHYKKRFGELPRDTMNSSSQPIEMRSADEYEI